jgi:hypothetical protein
MGGKSTSTSAPKLNHIAVQSSTLGLPVTIGWGRCRIKCNLIWYGAFTAIPHTTKTSSGKGLGGSSKNTTFTYTASIMMGLCEGVIQGVRTVYRDKSVFSGGSALADAGLSLATGGPDQSVWGYLTSRFPSQALNYSSLAYVYAQDYALNDTATLPNHSFEVDFGIQLSGLADADPKEIVTDVLTNAAYGLPGWTSALIGNLSDWSLYCRANNLLLSPALEAQVTGADFLTEIMTATNSEVVWSEGVLKVGTYGDAAATGNGVSWSPNLTPAYDLGEDDFIPMDGKPVQLSILDQSDAYNIVQVEYLDRANQYNTAIATAQDLANIVQYGKRRADPTTLHSICDAQIAQVATQLLLQRKLYRRETYKFRLPWNFVLLEPMIDYLTLTTTTDELKLNRKLVQIVEIEEDEDGLLQFTAEGVNVGNASAALYNPHSASSVTVNADVAPGSVSTPVIVNAPVALTGTDPQIWLAVSSSNANWGGCEVWISADNVNYERVGAIHGGARFGTLTATLPLVADPDTTSTLAVDLSTSLGQLGSATATGNDAGATLSLVGSEVISYRDATLTGANRYNLTMLHRGLYGTAPASHSSGASFVRLDDAVFKFSFATLNAGSTIYIKLPSFNIYGRALQDLSTLSAYTVALGSQSGRVTSTASVYLYQRAASTPAVPSSTLTYTFATATLTGTLGSWSRTIPAANGNPLYVTLATANSSGASDTIATGEWAAPVILNEDGASGLNGISVFLYKRAPSSPAAPTTTTTYTFSTKTLSGMDNGWSQTIPAGTDPIWVITASALSITDTDTIPNTEWATPHILAQNGADGTDGSDGADGTSPVLVTPVPAAAVIQLNADGSVKSGELPFVIAFSAIQGTSSVSVTAVSVSGTPTGCSGSGGTTSGSITALSAETGSITFNVTAGGSTVPVTVAFSTARAGGSGAASQTITVDGAVTALTWTSYAQHGTTLAINASSTGKLNVNLTGGQKPASGGSLQFVSKIQYSTDSGSTWTDVSGSEHTSTLSEFFAEPPTQTNANVNGSGPYSLTGLGADQPTLVRIMDHKTTGSDSSTRGVLTLYAEQVA